MTQKNTLLRVDGTKKELPDGELTLAQMYEAIDCDTVELVRLGDTSELWCDENGISARKPFNSTASALYRFAYRNQPEIDPQELGIVGDAILSTNATHS